MTAKDQESSNRIRDIIQCATYRRADRDIEFLDDDDVRGVRLQLDYYKTDLNLRRQGIEQTIVVFGSALIPDPIVAKDRVDKLQHLFRQPQLARSYRPRPAHDRQ